MLPGEGRLSQQAASRQYDNELVFQPFLPAGKKEHKTLNNTKFVVKVNRGGAHAPKYVQRIDRTPIQMTPDRRLALMMGRFTAEDAVKSIQTSRCSPELVSVRVRA
jgi:hypothetical protein